MTGPDVERVYKVKDDSVKLKRDRLKGQRIAPLMLKIEKARDGMYKGDLALEFEYTRSTMTPGHDPFEADPGGVQPQHPGGQASPAPTSIPTPTGASVGGHGAIGHSVPASPPAVPDAPPSSQGPSGQAVEHFVAPEAVTATGKVLAALAGFPEGETVNVIAKAAKLANAKAKEMIVQLVADGLVVAVKVTKLAGKGLKTFDGFAPVGTGGHHGPAAT